MFVDQARIFVKAGKGGRGCVSFLRERFRPFGGPDGGRGGKGGDVYLEGTPHLTTLTKVAKKVHYIAEDGKPGQGKNRYGRKGRDLIIPVPLGTIVRDEKTGEILGDVTKPGERLLVARGGKGGRGNKDFATATNQAPRIFEEGEEGEERWLILELKLLADVGLVGFPNAGKSTFLRSVTSAKPKVAPYPFTTLVPHLGICELEDYSSFVIADIPGILEGAHKGVGLGIDFLKHIERTSVILHMIDPASEDPARQYETIRRELASFSKELAQKKEVIALTKIDLPEVRERIEQWKKKLPGEVFAISSVTKEGVLPLLYRLKELVNEQREKKGALSSSS